MFLPFLLVSVSTVLSPCQEAHILSPSVYGEKHVLLSHRSDCYFSANETVNILPSPVSPTVIDLVRATWIGNDSLIVEKTLLPDANITIRDDCETQRIVFKEKMRVKDRCVLKKGDIISIVYVNDFYILLERIDLIELGNGYAIVMGVNGEYDKSGSTLEYLIWVGVIIFLACIAECVSRYRKRRKQAKMDFRLIS
jgi:hypothetical protein